MPSPKVQSPSQVSISCGTLLWRVAHTPSRVLHRVEVNLTYLGVSLCCYCTLRLLEIPFLTPLLVRSLSAFKSGEVNCGWRRRFLLPGELGNHKKALT